MVPLCWDAANALPTADASSSVNLLVSVLYSSNLSVQEEIPIAVTKTKLDSNDI